MVKNASKRQRKNKPTSKKSKFYTIDGDSVKRAKSCPRCGPGIFLADSQGRLYCGKCHYTEFLGKSDTITGESSKPEVSSPDVPSKEGKEGDKKE